MDKEILKAMEGKTIEYVDVGENHDGWIHSVSIKFTDGSFVELTSHGSDEGGWISVDSK
jgi:hypothetical protein